MSDKISVITVVYNDVEHIRQTMESFFSQTWENKEYIVIDGGSTDGTSDVIKEYSDRLAYWCSEKDDGIYDAMNKGIGHSTGDWINILNSGDFYTTERSLEEAMSINDISDVDVIYGNSIEISDIKYSKKEAADDYRKLEFCPIYRHGSSLIRTSVQKRFLYDTSMKKKLGYALDWQMIYRIFKAGFEFRKVDVFIESYRIEGVSNHQIRNLWYNYIITSQGRFSPQKALFFAKGVLLFLVKKSTAYRWAKAFTMEFMVNDVLPLIPFWLMRKFYLLMLGMRIGKGSFVMKRNYFINPNLIEIGSYSHINRGCTIDARGGITIGKSVSVSHNVCIMTGSHDIESHTFMGKFEKIIIGDYVWIGIGATILQGVRIGKGAVVCAGAVVTKDVEDYCIVAGVPARKIGNRRMELDYQCRWNVPLT